MRQQEIHHETVACLATLESAETAKELADYASGALKEGLARSLPRMSHQDPLEKLKSLRAQESFSGIAEIHPAWLVEILKGESPRVIGVILRHLPSKHVRYLLEALPQRTVVHLPKMVEAFYVPGEILEVIRKRFERHFIPMRISHEISQFGFEHLHFLKPAELSLLFQELGLSELALSLVGSPGKMVKMVLNRFQLPQAKALLGRIERYQREHAHLVQEAKYSVLEVEGAGKGADRFLLELGFQAVAKGFERGIFHLWEVLRQKMAPQEAYLLKRYMERQTAGLDAKMTKWRQEWVITHLRQLAEEEKIDSVWRGSLVPQAA